MSETSDRFFSECEKIQAHCCCRSINERDCYRLRYLSLMGDCFRYEDEDDSSCECVCHYEIGDLERDLWPDES
jgi:hypothetical protein